MAISSRLQEHRSAAAANARPDKMQPTTMIPDDEQEEIEEENMTEKKLTEGAAPKAVASEDLGSAVDAAISATNARWATVLGSEAATGRETAARTLLADTDMAADKIIAMLPGLSPVAAADTKTAADAQFRDRMLATLDADPAADLGGGAGEANNNQETSACDQILADQRAFTGKKIS